MRTMRWIGAPALSPGLSPATGERRVEPPLSLSGEGAGVREGAPYAPQCLLSSSRLTESKSRWFAVVVPQLHQIHHAGHEQPNSR